jgi:hypothetical protein
MTRKKKPEMEVCTFMPEIGVCRDSIPFPRGLRRTCGCRFPLKPHMPKYECEAFVLKEKRRK